MMEHITPESKYNYLKTIEIEIIAISKTFI